jgi:uncharacterized MAPEG superfamily protein
MISATLIVLLVYIGWSLFLLVLMESIRTGLVMTGKVAPSDFNPTNSNLSPFMQRLSRAHANCLEGFPIFGGLMLVAIITNNTAVTDLLAHVFIAARIAQSVIHLVSVGAVAVTLRFTAFCVQMLIAIYWCFQLCSVLL